MEQVISGTFEMVEQLKVEIVERYNDYLGERLKGLNLLVGGTVERWNSWTVERLNGETVERWNGWRG